LDACFTNARKIIGRETDVDTIMGELMSDESFYRESGGGITFSGGEALLQSEAVMELARRCRGEGIHTAIETAGFVPRSVLDDVLPLMDLVFFDLKHIDSEAHREFTGVPLDTILENLKVASAAAAKLVVRIPVVPGVNDQADTMRRMFGFLKEECGSPEVELLPFHRLGQGKYEGLGRHYTMTDSPNLGVLDCEPFAEIGRSLGLRVRTGGSGG
jgi:pyruvate formate lyase activating enzyme